MGLGQEIDEHGAFCNAKKEAQEKKKKKKQRKYSKLKSRDGVCQRDTGAIFRSSQWPKLDNLSKQKGAFCNKVFMLCKSVN